MIKAIKSYETSDGETFTRREDAEQHEAAIAVRAWIADGPIVAKAVDEKVSADLLARLIRADPDRARAVPMPLMPVKRPRAPKARPKKKATVAEYEDMLKEDAA